MARRGREGTRRSGVRRVSRRHAARDRAAAAASARRPGAGLRTLARPSSTRYGAAVHRVGSCCRRLNRAGCVHRAATSAALRAPPRSRRRLHSASCCAISASVTWMSSRCCSSAARCWASTARKRSRLRGRVLRRLVHVDQLAHLRQRQTEPLAAQRQLEARAVARRIDARQARAAAARGGEDALVLVEADRARSDVEFARELGDRVLRRHLGVVGARRTCAGRHVAVGGSSLPRRIAAVDVNVKLAPSA